MTPTCEVCGSDVPPMLKVSGDTARDHHVCQRAHCLSHLSVLITRARTAAWAEAQRR